MDWKEDEIARELELLLAQSTGHELSDLGAETSLDRLELDDLSRVHFAYLVERTFHVSPQDAKTLGDVHSAIVARERWRYPAPPGGSAVDRARGDFWPRILRPPAHLLMRGLARAAFGYRAEGRRHIPRRGPFVLVSNHAGHPDAPALMAALPLRRVNDTHPLAAQDYFFGGRALVEAPVRLFVNALPVDRHAPLAVAMHDALTLLHDERGIVLFPEGTRSPDGKIARFKRGVGFLLAGKPWPVIPAYIAGSRDVLPKGATWPRRGRVRVRIGEPRTYAHLPDGPDSWMAIAQELETEVKRLGE